MQMDSNITEHTKFTAVAKFHVGRNYHLLSTDVFSKETICKYLKMLLICSSLSQLHICVMADFLHILQPK